MSVRQTTVAMGFAVGMVLGVVVLTAFGQKSSSNKASRNPQVIAPRYSVQWESEQRLLLITDNFYNRLYMYSLTKQGSQLTSYIDLRQTGAGLLRAIGPPKSTKTKGKKSTPPKPKTKPKGKPKVGTAKKKAA
ncbi:MAG: hypothetical protein CMJ65_13205 [Planctomycetaceae bacterium]|jgi:hypothetical protein|nr:hypothetical protein [Planctomycetaceae bacterium]MDP7276572.1 hypothetical protein [Planctomycetaceae bacterium]